MKKKVLFLTMLFLLCLTCSVAYAADVTVQVDGKELPQKGVIIDGRTMVPIRDIAEAVGLTVVYENDDGREIVELQQNGIPVGLMVGESYYITNPGPDGLNQKFLESDVPLQNINSKLMMPLKVAAEMAHVDVNWDAANCVASVIRKPSAVSEDGKIDLMAGVGAHERKGILLKDAGFEIVSLTAEWDKYHKNGYYITCSFKNTTGHSFSAEVCIDMYDKATGAWIKGSVPMYRDSWAPGPIFEMSDLMTDFNPDLHEIDVIVIGSK